MSENKLDESGIGLCHRDTCGRVTFQNDSGKAICGEHLGQVCHGGCMEFRSALTEAFARPECSTMTLQSRRVHGHLCDVTYIKGRMSELTLLAPVSAHRAEGDTLAFAEALTPRELEVSQMIRRGYSNREIIKKMNISKATLKTHINRIYKKLGMGRRSLLGLEPVSSGHSVSS